MSPFTSFPRLCSLTFPLSELSLFALECINLEGQQGVGLGSPTLSASPTLSDRSLSSNFSALTMASESTVVSEHAPSAYEKTSYYNGITGDGNHPDLVYRSDFLTAPFTKPSGRHVQLPVKSLRGVHGTALNKVWDDVGPQVCDVVTARKIDWSSIGAACFFTHGPPGEENKGSLGPVVVRVGVSPGSTSPDTAHDVSHVILDLLRRNGVEDVVVEWHEAILQKLAGPPLMRHVGSTNATHYVRHGLSALLGVPLATQEREAEDAQGMLTLWFLENKDKDGYPSKKVYGVSNRHVLCRKYDTLYEPKGGAAKSYVCVCGMRRFQRILDDTKQAIADHGLLADLYAREIASLEAREEQDRDTAREIQRARTNLSNKKEDIEDLENFHAEVTRYWSDIKLHRNIGRVTYAPPITVDDGEGGTQFTSDWAVFEAAEAKVKASFEGNVVDLGALRFCFLVYLGLTNTPILQAPSSPRKSLGRCSIRSLVVRPRSSTRSIASSASRAASRSKSSPTLSSSTAKASAASWSAKTATRPTSLSDATPG